MNRGISVASCVAVGLTLLAGCSSGDPVELEVLSCEDPFGSFDAKIEILLTNNDDIQRVVLVKPYGYDGVGYDNEFTLPPGQTKETVFVLGAGECPVPKIELTTLD
jgi:hypothetical protein